MFCLGKVKARDQKQKKQLFACYYYAYAFPYNMVSDVLNGRHRLLVVYHYSLLVAMDLWPLTPGVVQVQRTPWRAWQSTSRSWSRIRALTI